MHLDKGRADPGESEGRVRQYSHGECDLHEAEVLYHLTS